MSGRLGAIARQRTDVALLAALLLGCALLPHGLPVNIAALGIVAGCALALQSVGLVLVYRANRIINFAQAQVGIVAGVVLFELLSQHVVLAPVWAICSSCVVHGTTGTVSIGGTEVHGSIAGGWAAFEFFVALLISWATGALVALGVYHGIIRRFQRAPRLIVTVVTIGVATALGTLATIVGHALSFGTASNASSIGGGLKLPLPDADFVIGITHFHTIDLLVVVATLAALAGLSAYLLVSARGVALRSAADNPERAQTLGINVGGVTGGVWLIAGMLSTIAATLSASIGASSDAGDIGVATIVRMLAVAVIARMHSLPITVMAAITLGVVNQGVLWNLGSDVYFEVLLAAVICGFLLLQRTRTTRAEQDVAASWPANREVRPIPRELRGLPIVSTLLRGGALIAIGIGLAFPWFMEPSAVSLGSATLIFGMLAFSLLILTGWAGQISLGHMALAGIGAYIAAIGGGNFGVPFIVVLPLAATAGGVAALLIGLPALRIRGLFLAATTLAFAVVISDVVLDAGHLGAFLPLSLNRPLLFGIDLNDERVFYYLCVVALAAVVVMVVGMRRSRTARALIACRDNPAAAQSFGIGPVRAQLTAFIASGAVAAFAGAMLAYEQHGLNASTYTPGAGIQLFLLAVIGGFGSIAGPLIAAAFSFGLSTSILGPLGYGAGLVLLLLLSPGGLTQIVVGIRDAVLRQIALRHRVVVPSLLADYRPGARGDERATLAPVRGDPPPLPVYALAGQWNVDGRNFGD